MEDQYIALYGSRKRRADKEKPSELTVVLFKVSQFQRRDGSLSEGPRMVDARKQHWDGAAIGNGSNVLIAFDLYDWDGENGCGMTFQPRVVQVVEFVPHEQVDPTDGFAEVEGYSTTATAASDWAAAGERRARAAAAAIDQHRQHLLP